MLLQAQPDARFADERLNWKLNALVSANRHYCAVKLVGSNAYNRMLGQPRSRSLLVLHDKLSMRPLSIFDGTELSARRTGAYASMVVDALLQQRPRFSVCLYDGGPIATCVLDDLQAHHHDRIERVLVYCRRYESAARFAAEASARTGLPVQAVAEKPAAGVVDLVITATNARTPLLDRQQVGPDTVALHLGGDELATGLIEWMLHNGRIVCDDPTLVCQRNSQSLPLYFSRQGLRLRDHTGRYQISSLPTLLLQDAAPAHGPALVTCVGLPMLDLCLAQWLYENNRQPWPASCDAAFNLREYPLRH